MLFASGDGGARPDGTVWGTEFPASDPNVLAVGGTNLALSGCDYLTCSGYASETGASIGGGGYSGYFAAANLLRTFSEKGIDVMPLKGLFLSHQYYKEPLMRYARDLDFLFRSKKDRLSAEHVLAEVGYCVSRAAPLQTRLTKYVSRFSVHCETHAVPISLNYAFEYPLWYDLWSRSRLGHILGASAYLMLPEDALLILCAHVIEKGTLSLRDFVAFVQILGKLSSSSWSHLRRVSKILIWRYIIAVPLALFCTIGEILLSKEFVRWRSLNSLAARTTIRIQDSRKLVSFMLREYGMPIDLRYVMCYFGYAGTPLFET